MLPSSAMASLPISGPPDIVDASSAAPEWLCRRASAKRSAVRTGRCRASIGRPMYQSTLCTSSFAWALDRPNVSTVSAPRMPPKAGIAPSTHPTSTSYLSRCPYACFEVCMPCVRAAQVFANVNLTVEEEHQCVAYDYPSLPKDLAEEVKRNARQGMRFYAISSLHGDDCEIFEARTRSARGRRDLGPQRRRPAPLALSGGHRVSTQARLRFFRRGPGAGVGRPSAVRCPAPRGRRCCRPHFTPMVLRRCRGAAPPPSRRCASRAAREAAGERRAPPPHNRARGMVAAHR